MQFKRVLWKQVLRVGIFLLIAVGGSFAAVATRSTTKSEKATVGLPLRAFQSDLFMGPRSCNICHVTDGTVLMTSDGEDVSMPTTWRSSMMANAFHDPYYQAIVSEEVKRRPALKEVIEDECLRCHAPMGITEYRYDQQKLDPPGDPHYSFAQARTDILAADSVSCTLCHQIQPDNLGEHASFTGGFVIRDTHEIFGPYDDVDPFFMESSVGFTPKFGAHKQESALCATCHTLLTPIFNDQNVIVGEFPEQTPFQEWKNSVYSSVGSAKSCQDCHMSRSDEPIIISNFPQGDPRLPFWRHTFEGSNVFMLTMLKNNIAELGLAANAEHFDRTIALTRKMLREKSAILEIVKVEAAEGNLRVDVKITNLAGHKLPTGYPRRRAWIHFVARDRSNGTAFFESGSFDGNYEINNLAVPFEPHHDVITTSTQTQIYESLIGDSQGEIANHLLSATQYLKDNRIPPKGFRLDGPDVNLTGIYGEAANDPNFNHGPNGEGSGTDIVRYEFPLTIDPANVQLDVEMLFQTIPPRHVNFLRQDPTTETQAFLDKYDEMANEPVLIARDTKFQIPPSELWTIY